MLTETTERGSSVLRCSADACRGMTACCWALRRRCTTHLHQYTYLLDAKSSSKRSNAAQFSSRMEANSHRRTEMPRDCYNVRISSECGNVRCDWRRECLRDNLGKERSDRFPPQSLTPRCPQQLLMTFVVHTYN